MSVLDGLLADLAAEGDALRAAVAGLGESGWLTPTPAEGWDIATTIAHLAWTDEASVLAIGAATPEGKERWDALVLLAIEDVDGFVDAEAFRVAAEGDLLARWDAARAGLDTALRGVPSGTKIAWFGPPMSPASMATARFMETWAHALDVYDALGLEAPRTDRVANVVHLGVRTRGFAYATHGLTPPTEELRLDLVLPSGEVWASGPEDAAQTITGSAWDFARLVTQRVHRDDTDLVAVGSDAEQWLGIAQAFAGPPGTGRQQQ
jgi:uncharacterized protein (TIGR03084 family)